MFLARERELADRPVALKVTSVLPPVVPMILRPLMVRLFKPVLAWLVLIEKVTLAVASLVTLVAELVWVCWYRSMFVVV